MDDDDFSPMFGYWKDASRFWAFMRIIGYKGHRGSYYRKGVWNLKPPSNRTEWTAGQNEWDKDDLIKDLFPDETDP